MRTWMEIGVESNHPPILFQLEKEMSKPSSPLKSNSNWLLEEDFINTFKYT